MRLRIYALLTDRLQAWLYSWLPWWAERIPVVAWLLDRCNHIADDLWLRAEEVGRVASQERRWS